MSEHALTPLGARDRLRHKPRSTFASSRLARTVRRWLGLPAHGSDTAYEELLYVAGRTQSLEDLLSVVPARLCVALELAALHLVLREGNAFVLRPAHGVDATATVFPASCATVFRMKRDRRPAPFMAPGTPNAQPDGWQLLAEPFELAALTALHAELLAPLEGRTGLMGFAVLARTGAAFTPGELRFLMRLGPQLGQALETAQLIRSISEQAIERARANRQLELAREVQERLLPRMLPRTPGLDAAAVYRSAEQIGGDYYDLFALPCGRVCAVVADVSGKGVPAALLMASLRAALHALLLEPGVALPGVLARLNEIIYESSSASRYATVFVTLFHPRTTQLTYTNAGHNPPLILRADGSLLRLTVGGTVVGLLPGARYDTETLTLAPGDTLIAYTDGVTEAARKDEEQWETALLEAALAPFVGVARCTATTSVETILERLSEFTAGAAQQDDLTLLVLRCCD